MEDEEGFGAAAAAAAGRIESRQKRKVGAVASTLAPTLSNKQSQLKKIVPEFGQDPFKELDDVWQDTFAQKTEKKVDSNAGGLLLKKMH